MRIHNITGNGSWQAVTIPPEPRDYDIAIQNSASVNTEVRGANNPTETWTVKSGQVFNFNITTRSPVQLEVMAASGTIQVFVNLRVY